MIYLITDLISYLDEEKISDDITSLIVFHVMSH